MKLTIFTLCLLLLSLCDGLSLEEDDIVFDDVSEGTPVQTSDVEQLQQDQPPAKAKSPYKSPKKWHPVEKLLGMPDAVASEGHAFKLKIHKQAFSGSIDYYEVG